MKCKIKKFLEKKQNFLTEIWQWFPEWDSRVTGKKKEIGKLDYLKIKTWTHQNTE